MHPIQRGKTVRTLTGLLIAFAVLGTSSFSAAAQENGLASITIYASLCPEGYTGDDYYADCYDTPAGAGIDYTLTDLNDTSRTYGGSSGASGFAAIEGIDEDGFYQLSFEVPFAITSAPGNCSEDGAAFPVGSEYQFNLTTDNDIRCDIFITPASTSGGEPGSVTIYKTMCPVGYEGTDYYADCYDNPVEGVTFTATPQQESNPENAGTLQSGLPITAITNSNGVATLSLSQFTWGITEDIPGDFIDRFFVYCSLNGARHEIGISDTGILVDVPAGADVRCDWYNVPTNARGTTGSLTIYKTACPAGYTGTDYYKDCYDNPEAGIGFGASAPKLAFEAQGTTDANGFVTLPLPDENTIGSPISVIEIPIVEVPGGGNPPFFVYCSVDGKRLDVTYSLIQLDPGGDAYAASISPEAGDEVRCDWYNLPPKKSAPAPSPAPIVTQPVTRLPSTGTGASTGTAVDGFALGISLLTIGGLGAAAVARRRNHRTAA